MAEIKVSQSSYLKIQQLAKQPLLNAVRVYPDKVSFDGQDLNENIVLFLRQHPVIFLPTIFRSIGIIVLGTLLSWVFSTLSIGVAKLGTVSFAFFVIGLAISITNFVYDFLRWYYTVTIITSTRVIDLDFNSVMDSKWSTTMLRAIQDVSYESPGFFNALFDMADLQLLTAAHKDNFELANLPKARDVQDIIMDLVETEKNYVPDDESI